MKHTPKLLASVAAIGLAGSAYADQVILDDLIVDGSACIGLDCANGENFGFDTIRMKENNTRLKFDDTSATASFPNVDWQLTANESTNGGLNKFSIEDITNGRIPFTVEASAPTNALFIEDTGDVGVGTNNPVLEMHIVDGDSPSIRIEQDGSSGFTPQTWDMAGNETNFFVRDVTNGSALPFRIFPGNSNDDGLVIRNSRVGIYTDNPQSTLHVQKSDGTTQVLVKETNATQGQRVMLELENKGDPTIQMLNTAFPAINWQMRAGQRFIIDDSLNSATGNFLFDLTAAGDLSIAGSLTTGGAGACSATPCDAVFDPEVYSVPSIEEHAAEMWKNKHLPAVGPTLPNQPVDVTVKLLRMLNELEHAHIYIEQLHARVETLEEKLIAQ